MTEPVHECEHKNISVLVFGFRCEDCGEVWDIASAIDAIRATERLSAKQAIRLREMFYPVVYDNEPDALSLVRSLNAYASTLEGKC